tara:strand:- start:272 stop:877 length:606 start_codon:yes stop_codon:yes gene_type:complete
MNFLSIDCSTDIGSLFIKAKTKTFSKVLQSDKSNSDLLMQQIIDFFTENNLKFDDISQIFVNQGPGNFSGLRSSLAVAKGVSISKNLNLYGYNTFLWSSGQYFNKKENIFSLIKFREEYFIKKYDKKFKKISKTKKVSISEIIKKYNNKFIIAPKNIIEHFDKKILKLDNLKIVDLDHNVLEFLHLKGLLNEKFIKPFYLT